MQQLQLVTEQIKSQKNQQKLQQDQQQFIVENSNNIKVSSEGYLDSQMLALLLQQQKQEQQKNQDDLLLHRHDQPNINEVSVNVDILNKNNCQNVNKSQSLLESHQVLMQYLNAIKQQKLSTNLTQNVQITQTSAQISPTQNVLDVGTTVEFNSTNKPKLQNLTKNLSNVSQLKNSNKTIDDNDDDKQTQKIDFQRQLQVAQLREKKAIDAVTLLPPTSMPTNNSAAKQRIPYSHESFHTIMKFLMDFNLVSFFINQKLFYFYN